MTDTARIQSAGQTAALGAKAGSIIPVVGTVIGAVVGAVVGWLATKKKPPRPSPQQVAECKALLNEYMSFAGQMPTQPIPLDQEQLRQLNWCLDALYGSKVGLKDPRYFDPDVAAIFIPMAKQIVRLIYETPVGATVSLGKLSVKIGKQTFSFAGYSFVNPAFTNLKNFCDDYFVPIAVQLCKETAGKGAGGCDAYYGQTPEFRRWLFDLLGWAARTELPNISEADLSAASQVAATVPGSSAKDVVSAVEQIMGRTVQQGETAAVLTPATGPPPALPIVPTGPPTSAPPASGIVPPTFAEPSIPPTPTLPASPFPLPFAPTMPGVPTPFLPLAPNAKPQGAVATDTGQWFENPFVIGGAVLATGAFLYSQRRKRR